MKKVCLAFVLVAACGSDSTRKQLFTPKPECMGDAITPYMGTDPVVINTLAIGSLMDGFDLDGDGKPDNKLSAVSSLAQSQIDNSIKNYEIVIPIEYFDMPAVAADKCVKFAIYLGKFDVDGDGDGKRPGMPNTTDMMDRDSDGQTVAQGDCDDTDATVKHGATEICGDGKDNNCDGVADRTVGMDPDPCGPFVSTADITLDKLSFDTSGAPVIAFDNGAIDKNLVLDAGPSIFSVNIPVTNGITLDLKITGAQIQGDMQADGTVMNGRLGGVIDARSMDTITGLNVSQIGLTPNDSLLDATFGNLLGPLLALPKANAAVQKKYPGCRTPDIDVDGDGLEAFCSTDPNATNKVADVCIDGDGTEIHSTYDANGNIIDHCAQAVDSHGKPRFVDGVSVELNFTTSKIHQLKPPM